MCSHACIPVCLFCVCLCVMYLRGQSGWGHSSWASGMLAKRGRFGLGSNQRLLALSFFKFVPRSGLSAVFFHFCGSKKRSLQTTPGYARLFFLKDYSCVSELPVTADQYNTDLSRVTGSFTCVSKMLSNRSWVSAWSLVISALAFMPKISGDGLSGSDLVYSM